MFIFPNLPYEISLEIDSYLWFERTRKKIESELKFPKLKSSHGLIRKMYYFKLGRLLWEIMDCSIKGKLCKRSVIMSLNYYSKGRHWSGCDYMDIWVSHH